MTGGLVILLAWSFVEGAVARNFRRVGDLRSARLHRDFAIAMAAIGAVLGALAWIAR